MSDQSEAGARRPIQPRATLANLAWALAAGLAIDFAAIIILFGTGT